MAVSSQMVKIDGGEFSMGSLAFYPEEAPVQRVRVDAFLVSRTPVTNAEFQSFVEASHYVTTAELEALGEEEPERSAGPGSLVFVPTSGPVDLRDWTQWWSWVPGASWRHPQGPESTIEDKADHPVVHISHADAEAYASWAGARLLSEREWEFAARGGLDNATFSWGEEPQEVGALKANTWQGQFPHLNEGAMGFYGTSPVGTFKPNGYGLFDMTGNVWEWTSTRWSPNHRSACSCGPTSENSAEEVQFVVKGGSHLCSPQYCLRYRPAARSPQYESAATSHLGFRVGASVS